MYLTMRLCGDKEKLSNENAKGLVFGFAFLRKLNVL